MIKRFFLLLLLISSIQLLNAQQFYEQSPEAKRWVKKQFRKLNKDQRIAQLMIIRAHSNLGQDHIAEVTALIKNYNVGGLCFFQGGPVRQAVLTNQYQQMAKTPLMISIDAEWGLGMRLDSVINYPRQLMMGAVNDASLIHSFGKAVGEQCKRLGIQVNYAPDIDINNNPMNPVINDRSFGEDKYKVALFGTAYMKGMQEVGVMATGKHFPGHGDVAVDSHYDLPLVNKSRAQLDSLELYPFRELIKGGIGSMMIAHLYIPSIDTTANLATTLSRKNVTDLLKTELGFKGLTFTDALEMKGITKFFPAGEASVQALIAGNDMLCLPGDVPGTITKIRAAIKEGRLSWDEINERVKKVLLAKYNLGLNNVQPIDTNNLVKDLNVQTNIIRAALSKNAITLLRKNDAAPFPIDKQKKIAYISIGAAGKNFIATKMETELNATIYQFASKAVIGKQLMDDQSANIIPADKSDSSAAIKLIQLIQSKNYDAIVIGLHNYSRRPANNFGLSSSTVYLLNQLQSSKTTTVFFGNPYAVSNCSNAPNLLVSYEDDDLTQLATYDVLTGANQAKGILPVTVAPNLLFGTSIPFNPQFAFSTPEAAGLNSSKLQQIDAIVTDAINKGAFPGCVVLVARKGKIAYEKAFGYTNFDQQESINTNMIYDLASVTKVSATTVSIMKLYEEGRISLEKTLGDYLPWVKGSDKAGLKIKDILLHQAGLNPFIPFYKELIDSVSGKPLPDYFSTTPTIGFTSRVAENVYLRNDWQDSLYKRILQSKLTPAGKYVYSDNDFIFLGKIVEALSGLPLNEYVQKNIYKPLQMTTTGFNPRERFTLNSIVPTEEEKHFRGQLIRGDVHDEGASLFGGVAGHAGLFSNAKDLAQLYQLLLNGGTLNGIQLFKKETIQLFTAYNSEISRRGLGFDKPEKDNLTRKDPYPSKSVSSNSFGHTGFTGTCVWVDPDKELVYIFLSNRVTPTRNNNKLSQLNVRSNIQEAIYQALL
ncbi:MAG: serine hydrolase [Sphingobacteriia bacterium]|nr:MAG: serine hydrolase [Sphingobacteriia bacterium]